MWRAEGVRVVACGWDDSARYRYALAMWRGVFGVGARDGAQVAGACGRAPVVEGGRAWWGLDRGRNR